MATSAPSSARALAIAAPMPREPPVTRATFPERVFAMRPSPFVELFSNRYICMLDPGCQEAYITVTTKLDYDCNETQTKQAPNAWPPARVRSRRGSGACPRCVLAQGI